MSKARQQSKQRKAIRVMNGIQKDVPNSTKLAVSTIKDMNTGNSNVIRSREYVKKVIQDRNKDGLKATAIKKLHKLGAETRKIRNAAVKQAKKLAKANK